MNTIPVKREWLINNGCTTIIHLCLSISDFKIDKYDIIDNTVDRNADLQLLPLDENVRLPSISKGREEGMLVFHNTLNILVQISGGIIITGFLTCSHMCSFYVQCADIIKNSYL